MKVEQLIKLLEAVPPDSEVMIETWNDYGDHSYIVPANGVKFNPEHIPQNPEYPSRPNQLILS